MFYSFKYSKPNNTAGIGFSYIYSGKSTFYNWNFMYFKCNSHIFTVEIYTFYNWNFMYLKYDSHIFAVKIFTFYNWNFMYFKYDSHTFTVEISTFYNCNFMHFNRYKCVNRYRCTRLHDRFRSVFEVLFWYVDTTSKHGWNSMREKGWVFLTKRTSTQPIRNIMQVWCVCKKMYV